MAVSMDWSSGILTVLGYFSRRALLNELYSHPSVCFLTFRELPEIARNIVSRLLPFETAVSVLKLMQGNIYGKVYAESLKVLLDLAILEEITTDNTTSYTLTTSFRSSLRSALAGGGAPWIHYPPPGDSSKTTKTVEFLERYAVERWDCLLYTLVLPHLKDDVAVGGISKNARNLLIRAGLLQNVGDDSVMVDDRSLTITPKGFQFLLLDKRSQAWILASALIGKDSPSCDAAVLLCNLALCRPSTVEYSTTIFSSEQLAVLACLREFGFVYQRTSRLPRFYVTSLSSAFSSNVVSFSTSVTPGSHGQICVETNFRLYAYTESRLDAALLSMFSEPICRFQNMIVAALTRDSFKKALTVGITAQQVIDFLKSRAKVDPESLHGEKSKISSYLHSSVPPAVADQMHVWELERCRLKFHKAVLYSGFDNPADYNLLRDYAGQIGGLLWSQEDSAEVSSSRRQMMAVTQDGHEKLRSFWRRRRKADSAG